MIPQIGIMLFGVSAIWLVGCRTPRIKRWGYVCGLCSRPFWLWTTIAHEQWGIAMMSALYGFSWARGAMNHWRVRELPPSCPDSHDAG